MDLSNALNLKCPPANEVCDVLNDKPDSIGSIPEEDGEALRFPFPAAAATTPLVEDRRGGGSIAPLRLASNRSIAWPVFEVSS